MRQRYLDAHQEIRTILRSRPHLSAKQLWNELTTWPIPSLRTIHRIAQGVKRDLAIGRDLAAADANRDAQSTRVEAADALLTGDTKMAEKSAMDELLDAVKGMCKGVMDRMDAMEEQHKKDRTAHADAAEKAEREAADAAAAVAAKQRADAASLDRRDYVASQVKFDSAYQAFGTQAPPALEGETPLSYRIRLATGLKQYSRAYKDSNLSLVADPAAFNVVEQAIINDAIEASCAPGAVGAPLVARTKADPHTGHRITTFHGDPGVAWAEFAGGSIMYGRLNQAMIDKATRAN